MPDAADYELDKTEPPPGFSPPKPSSPAPWIALAAVVIAAGALVLYLRKDPAPAPADGVTQTEVPVTEAPQPLGTAVEPIALPPLDESDALVRSLVRALSSHPRVAAWLTTNGLIRNFAVVVENIAYGMVPSGHLRPLRPSGTFRVLERNGDLTIDPRTYARYDGIADAVASVDTVGAAKLYAGLKPRLQEAYAELGREEPFDQVLERAIVVLLRVPTPPDTVRLEPAGAVEYKYADARLEALTQPQKQLLRMGPRNIGIIQGKLRDLAIAIGIPAGRVGAP